MSETNAARTRLMARALGPFLIFVAVITFARYENLPVVLAAFARDAPLMLVAGALTTLAGLFLLAAHHHFGSPAAIAVSTLAILIIIRGVFLAVAPGAVIAMINQVTHWPMIMLGTVVVTALCGAWLLFVGWFAKSV